MRVIVSVFGPATHGSLIYAAIGVHKAFYKCLHPHRITIPATKEEVYFSKDELINIEHSLKVEIRLSPRP